MECFTADSCCMWSGWWSWETRRPHWCLVWDVRKVQSDITVVSDTQSQMSAVSPPGIEPDTRADLWRPVRTQEEYRPVTSVPVQSCRCPRIEHFYSSILEESKIMIPSWRWTMSVGEEVWLTQPLFGITVSQFHNHTINHCHRNLPGNKDNKNTRAGDETSDST